MDNSETKWEIQNELWKSRLATLASETQLSPELIEKSRHTLIDYFGEEWLKEMHSKNKEFSPSQATGIVGVVTNPMDNHGVEVVELAKYLNAVKDQDNFADIITKLKNADDYKAIRLNLAVGYRLKNAGWKNIYVEPEVGDISGELFGKKYVIECSVITPPNPASKYTHEIFRSIYKFLKKNDFAAWIHVQFNKDFKTVPIANVINAIKELNYRFAGSDKPAETLTDEFNITETLIDEKVKSLLKREREKEENSLTEIGYRIAMVRPAIAGDLHSVDPDDPTQVDSGSITFGGVHKYNNDKSTAERIKTKIKNKKSQTANLPSGTRRMFVFMAHGMVDQEDWSELGNTIAKSTDSSDNLDAILFMDRRRHEIDGKLRFPSAQVHFFTKNYRLTALEASFRNMKAFEQSDWIEAEEEQ